MTPTPPRGGTATGTATRPVVTKLTAGRVAELVGGQLEDGDADTVVLGAAPLDQAGPTQLSFVADARYAAQAALSAAGTLLIGERYSGPLPEGCARIRVPDAHQALAKLLPTLYPEPLLDPGIHLTAVIDPTVELGEGVRIEAYVVVGAGTRVGDGSRIGAHTVIGDACELGSGCILHPQVTLYPRTRLGNRCIVHSGAVLGSDGYGYAWNGREHQKVPQVGGCVLADDVEVGANSCIDRGSVGDTRVGADTKLDNLVHIAHNVRVGEHVLMVAQVGVAGSTSIGDGVVLAGQVGVAGHLSIGAGATGAARAAILQDVAPGETVTGYPARPHREFLRAQAAFMKLPALLRRVARLESRLESRAGPGGEDTVSPGPASPPLSG